MAMTTKFEFKIENMAGLKDFIKQIDTVTKEQQRILYRANRSAMERMRLRASQLIRHPDGGLNLPAAYVKDKLQLSHTSLSKPNGRLYAEKRGVLMSRFKGFKEMRGGGFQAKMYNGRPIAKFPFSFSIRGKNSLANLIMIRTSKPGKGAWLPKNTSPGTKRKYIKPIYGASVSQALNQHLPVLQKEALEMVQERLKYELKEALRRGRIDSINIFD